MALEKGSPAYLAIDRGISFGDTIETPVGDGSWRERFRITAIGEYHVLGRKCGTKAPGGEWEADGEEGPEVFFSPSHLDRAERVG